jgi:CBS-domain-containing membrane protein
MSVDVTVDFNDVLRDALGRLLAEESKYAPVLDGEGRVSGVLSMDVIAQALNVPASETRTSSELVMDE